MKELKYVCKQDVINKGLCKQGGYIYKKSVLEIWYSKGWLELERYVVLNCDNGFGTIQGVYNENLRCIFA